MKKIIYTLISASLLLANACQLQEDSIGEIGPEPTTGDITIDSSDPNRPVFTASSDHGFVFHWDLDNNQLAEGETVTSYYPFAGDYAIECVIGGAGGATITSNKVFNVATTDPAVGNLPVWKELTGGGTGKTWVYNTDPATGFPDYSYQTGSDLVNYPDAWTPAWSWGQCVRITPDINGEMYFDLNGGINYTYYQTAGGAGESGSFILDADNMTITIATPYILDYNIACTNAPVTALGVFQIKLITDDEMVLWQMQEDEWSTGWGWSFKRKGS